MSAESPVLQHPITFPPSVQGVPGRSAEKNYSKTHGREQDKEKKKQQQQLVEQPRLRAKGQSGISTDINHGAAQLPAAGPAPTSPGRCEIPAVRNN